VHLKSQCLPVEDLFMARHKKKVVGQLHYLELHLLLKAVIHFKQVLVVRNLAKFLKLEEVLHLAKLLNLEERLHCLVQVLQVV